MEASVGASATISGYANVLSASLAWVASHVATDTLAGRACWFAHRSGTAPATDDVEETLALVYATIGGRGLTVPRLGLEVHQFVVFVVLIRS